MRKFSSVAMMAIFVGTVFLTSSFGFSVFRVYRQFQSKRFFGKQNLIDTIVQTGPEKGALHTTCLAEILELSADHPTNFYRFDEEKAREKLLSLPVVKQVIISKEKPATVYIDYAIRQPIALLGDFNNTGIDKDKRVFPIAPFYSPKRIPEIYLGISIYPEALEGKEIDLAFRILDFMERGLAAKGFLIERVDVSNAFCESYGKREVVVVLQRGSRDKGRKIYLRMSPREHLNEFNSFLSLCGQLQEEMANGIDKVIDLRIPNLAYIEDFPNEKG